MKKIKNTAVAFACISTLAICGVAAPATAAPTTSPSSDLSCNSSEMKEALADEDVALACKIAELDNSHLSVTEDGKKLETDLSDEQLKDEYSFSQEQVQDFRSILDGNYQSHQPSAQNELSASGTEAHIEGQGGRFYISNEQLTAGTFVALATAAEAGPEALAAASVAVSGALGGPIGAALSGGVALLGIGFFVDLAAKIVGALAQGKGVALYAKWGFPPIESKIE